MLRQGVRHSTAERTVDSLIFVAIALQFPDHFRQCQRIKTAVDTITQGDHIIPRNVFILRRITLKVICMLSVVTFQNVTHTFSEYEIDLDETLQALQGL